MALGDQHVSEFSPDGKLFALINGQGILKIWDTETNELKQEFTPNLHLAGPCSALTWVPMSQEKKLKKQRKLESNTNGSLYIALGTSTGHISMYSYALGKVERKLKGEGHAGKVTCVVYDNAGTLYTSGEDCQIIVWNIAEEKRITSWSVGTDKPYTIAYMAKSNNLVIGSRQIKVYSVETQEIIQTFTGHTSEVSLMSSFVVDDTEYAITASKMERILCLWKIGRKGRNKTASSTLLMEDIAHCLTCQVDDEGKLKVASVTRSGVIHVYLVPLENIKAEKPIKPKVTIEIASDSSTVVKPIQVVAATLQHGLKAAKILFGYGDKHFMMFEQIAPNYAEKLEVLVRSDPKKVLSKKSSNKEQDTSVAIKTITPVINVSEVDYRSTVAVSKKLKSIEIPMESRLQNLNLNGSGGVIQAQSKVRLLVQALHSKDASLLRTVLSTDDSKTIQLTLQKLPVQYVGCLVNELTLLMQKKRTNVEFAITWLKILAETHSSQLMALGTEDLLNKFGPCIGIIEHRANCLKEISKLNGRLQLLVSQLKRNTEEDNLNSEHVLVFEDNDSSSSDLNDNTGDKIESDDEWDEDGDSVEDMET